MPIELPHTQLPRPKTGKDIMREYEEREARIDKHVNMLIGCLCLAGVAVMAIWRIIMELMGLM